MLCVWSFYWLSTELENEELSLAESDLML